MFTDDDPCCCEFGEVPNRDPHQLFILGCGFAVCIHCNRDWEHVDRIETPYIDVTYHHREHRHSDAKTLIVKALQETRVRVQDQTSDPGH